MTTQIAVLGDGAWGTAVAILLAKNPEHQISLWSARSENAKLLREHRENVRLLPGVPIPERITLTEDVHQAVDGATLWITAIPTIYLRTTLETIAATSPPFPPATLSLTKGMEVGTFQRPTQIISDVLGDFPQAVLSGPSHAEEVSRGMPTSVVVASEDEKLGLWIQELFNSHVFRAYTSTDLIGVELGGALKNVLGLAAGINDGLGLGDNAKSALLTRGLVEMTRFGSELGANPKTFSGLAGLGDLITTCMSPHGRNRKVGERLGRGEKLGEVLAGQHSVAEGIHTTRSVHDRAMELGIDMPITQAVWQILYEDKDPRESVTELMLRPPRGEL